MRHPPESTPRLLFRVVIVRYLARTGDGERLGFVVVRPVQPRAEVAPCSLSIHDEELFPLVLRFVNLSGTGGHVQHFTIGVAKGRGGEVGDGSGLRPPHGDTPQRIARVKGLLFDRGDALRDGDACQLLATHKSFLSDCFKAALRELDACQHIAIRKGLISDAGHAGFDHYGFDFLIPKILPRLIVEVGKVRHRLGRVGVGIGDGEGTGGVVVRPVQAGAEVAPRQLLNGELSPHRIPSVSLPRAAGHMQRHACRRRDAIKDTRRDGERRIPEYGHALQRRAISKGAISDRGDAVRDGDALQRRAFGEGLLSDRVHTLRDGEVSQRPASKKGVLSDRGELTVIGQRNISQRMALIKDALFDRFHAFRDREVGELKASSKGALSDRFEALGQVDACQPLAPRKGALSDRAELRVSGQRDVCQLLAINVFTTDYYSIFYR